MEQVYGVNAHKRSPKPPGTVVLTLKTHKTSNKEHSNMKKAILSVATVVYNMLRNNALHMASNMPKQHMPPHTDKKGVERLIGTVNYLAKFIPNMPIITIPI